MTDLREDIRSFRQGKADEQRRAGQTAAFFIALGVDLSDALASRAEDRARIVLRLERLIERERQRGMRRHWTYDLNRHIALKQALDRLRSPLADHA